MKLTESNCCVTMVRLLPLSLLQVAGRSQCGRRPRGGRRWSQSHWLSPSNLRWLLRLAMPTGLTAFLLLLLTILSQPQGPQESALRHSRELQDFNQEYNRDLNQAMDISEPQIQGYVNLGPHSKLPNSMEKQKNPKMVNPNVIQNHRIVMDKDSVSVQQSGVQSHHQNEMDLNPGDHEITFEEINVDQNDLRHIKDSDESILSINRIQPNRVRDVDPTKDSRLIQILKRRAERERRELQEGEKGELQFINIHL